MTEPGRNSLSADTAEIAKFGALAARWWDPGGPMAPLHRMNPLRVRWISDRIARRFPSPSDVRLLDIGCGAGLASEALARRGYDVLGIDASTDAIEAARSHARTHVAGNNLRLAYRAGIAEDLAGERFDVITALEVIEHVPSPEHFVQSLAGLLAPGGLLFLSTLNRTGRSLLTAKIGAEYVLRILPVGTHDWRRFIRPVELAAMLRAAGLSAGDLSGMVPDLRTGGWRESRDLAVNYIAAAHK